MKVVFKIAAAWAAIFFIIYVAGSFTAASFNISEWTYASRSLCGLFGAVGAVFSGVILLTIEEK